MPKKSASEAARRNLILISDTHSGCQVALCHPDGCDMDGGGLYSPSKLQRKMWSMWEEFWGEWVPRVTHGEPFTVVHNGDAIDGVHHGSTTQITHNMEFQRRHAAKILKPVVDACDGRYYHIRGTEAHVGQSAEHEEALARSLGAVPDEEGHYARFELWFRMANGGLVHCMHHIGTTGSAAYEATAVHKELAEAYVEAGRWGDEPPQVVVRSHRHRNYECRMPCKAGYAMALVTPAWQLKTPFTYKIPGGRIAQPQIGGCVVRMGDEELHARHRVWRIERPKEV
jgi:hypothetical protein